MAASIGSPDTADAVVGAAMAGVMAGMVGGDMAAGEDTAGAAMAGAWDQPSPWGLALVWLEHTGVILPLAITDLATPITDMVLGIPPMALDMAFMNPTTVMPSCLMAWATVGVETMDGEAMVLNRRPMFTR